MALVVGTNSWSTRAEADAYLTDRIGATDWFGLADVPANPGEDSKDSFLISAFHWLQGSPELDIPSSASDDGVKNAQIEAALFLYSHYSDLDERRAAISMGVSSFAYSKRREIFDPSQLTIPAYILGMVSEYAKMNTTALLLGEYDA
jgi:hypothetical protein